MRRTTVLSLCAVLAVLLAILGFLKFTSEVGEGETASFDRSILLAFRMPSDLGTPIGPLWLQETGRDVTALGGFTTLTFVSVVAIAILLLQGRRTQAAVFTGTVVSAQLTAEVIKALVNRPRPDLVPHFDLVYSASFPSGHAVMAPVVYLTLAAIVSAGEHRPTIKMLLIGSAVLLVVSIGISRVYLGVHWPSDVLAGWLLGTTMAGFASALVFRFAPKRSASADSVQSDDPVAQQ